MPNCLRVGILGLGRRWRRYRLALGALSEQIEAVAVCDPRPGRAVQAARELGCPIAEGPVALLERDEVQALLVLDTPWYGLWPIEQACAFGKPVLCAASLARDDAHADLLVEQVRAARLPVLMALPESVAPAQVRLTRLLATELGPARLVRAERSLPLRLRGPLSAANLVGSGPLPGLLIGVEALLGAPPRTVWAGGTETGLVTLLLDHGQGRSAQVTLWAGSGRVPPTRLDVVAAGGSATLSGPGRLCWRDTDGSHAFRQPVEDPVQALLERFVQSLHDGRPLWPGLNEAYAALRVLRAARRSLTEGRVVPV
jgi:predicted dehydrogenase